jgi:hypothetical protein
MTSSSSDVVGEGIVDSDPEVVEDRHGRSVDRTDYGAYQSRAREGCEQFTEYRSRSLGSQLRRFELL